jgi:hypothetical protein
MSSIHGFGIPTIPYVLFFQPKVTFQWKTEVFHGTGMAHLFSSARAHTI